MRPGLPALLVLAASLGTGCGIKSTAHLVAADRAVHRAEDRGAASNAAYEYTLAVRYLDKAREEAAHARHGDAISLAREAEGYADRAVIVMQEKGLGSLDEPAAGTPEATPEPVAPPAPEPAAPPTEEPVAPAEPSPAPPEATTP